MNHGNSKEVTELDKLADKDFQLRRNLSDAGCDAPTMEKFFRLRAGGRFREQLRLLSHQRKCLLEKLHAEQEKIDSLDFLIYAMKTEESIKKKKRRISGI